MAILFFISYTINFNLAATFLDLSRLIDIFLLHLGIISYDTSLYLLLNF